MKSAGIALFVSTLLFLAGAACGGGNDKGPSSGPISALPAPQTLPHSITHTAAAIKAAHGDRNGAAAVLRASDRGYSIQQISGAGVGKRLTAQGVIQNAGGGNEAPTQKPFNRFSRAVPSDGGDLRLRALSLDLLGDILNDIGGPSLKKTTKPVPPPSQLPPDDIELEEDLTTVTLSLLAMGYDIEQIAEAVVFGDFIFTGWGVYVIAGEDGFVCPNLAADCKPKPAREALDAFLPGGLGRLSAEPTATPQPTQTAASNTQCVRAVVVDVPAGVNATMNDTIICSVRGGGPISGRVQLVMTSRDADCEGTFSYDLTLDGTLASPILSGKFSGSARIGLAGECRQERVLFTDLQPKLEGAWEGTLEGPIFKGTIFVDPDDKDETLLLEGRLQ